MGRLGRLVTRWILERKTRVRADPILLVDFGKVQFFEIVRWFESTPPQRHLRWCHPGQCHWSDRCKERQVCTLLTMINVMLPSSCPREKEVCNNNAPLAEVGRTQLHVRRYASPKKPSTAYRNSRPRRTGPRGNRQPDCFNPGFRNATEADNRRVAILRAEQHPAWFYRTLHTPQLSTPF